MPKSKAKAPSSYENDPLLIRAFKGPHRKVFLVVALVLVLFVAGGVIDLATSFGKIHAGVKVQGVSVGGMTVDEAAKKIQKSLTPTLNKAKITVYASKKAAKKDGYKLTSTTEEGVAEADELTGAAKQNASTRKWTITADNIGASIDGDALAQEAYSIGRSATFFTQRIGALFGAYDLDASIVCDKELLTKKVSKINKRIGTKIRNYGFEIENGEVTLKSGHNGWVLDEDAFVTSVSNAIFGDGGSAFVAPMKTETVQISKATAQKVVSQLKTAISQDIVVTYDGETWNLDASVLGNFITSQVLEEGKHLVIAKKSIKVIDDSTFQKVEQSDGYVEFDSTTGLDENSNYTLEAYIDQKKARDYLGDLLGDKVETGVKDASFYIKDHSVQIHESVAGSGPDRASAAFRMQKILFGTAPVDSRTIALSDVTIQPTFTTADAKALHIKDKLGQWSISLGGTNERMHNINLLCKMITKSLIAPGETWSFNQTTGERTEAKGFQAAPVITDGKHEDQLGGGVCQVATCVYNAACYTGLRIESRVNHSFYIDAYDDEGFADATVSWEEPDLQFTNDMDSYILMIASFDIDESKVTVTMWGTDDGRKVTCDRGKWKKGSKYKTIYEADDELTGDEYEVEQEGKDGRKIIINYHVVAKDGTVLHDVDFVSYYIAQNEIIKVAPTSSKLGGKSTVTVSNSDKDSDSDTDGTSSDDSSGDDDDDSTTDSN